MLVGIRHFALRSHSYEIPAPAPLITSPPLLTCQLYFLMCHQCKWVVDITMVDFDMIVQSQNRRGVLKVGDGEPQMHGGNGYSLGIQRGIELKDIFFCMTQNFA